jgi:hypothetical protein
VANANKLNSTVYFFFGVFLGLTALVFFGDLVAFFAGLAAGFFAAAGILAFGFFKIGEVVKPKKKPAAKPKKAVKPKAAKPTYLIYFYFQFWRRERIYGIGTKLDLDL